MKPPKASSSKRKRGRPIGASGPEPDASDLAIVEQREGPDDEEGARPGKRGRKKVAEATNMTISPARRSRPSGRATKNRRQNATNSAVLGGKQRNSAEELGTDSKAKGTMMRTNGKALQGTGMRADQKQPKPKPQSSGRQRRSWDVDRREFIARRSDDPKDKVREQMGPKDADKSENNSTEIRTRALRRRKESQEQVEARTVTEQVKPKNRRKNTAQEKPAATAQTELPMASTETREKRRRARLPRNRKDNSEGWALQEQAGTREEVPGEQVNTDDPSADRFSDTTNPRRRGRQIPSNVQHQDVEKDAPSGSSARPLHRLSGFHDDLQRASTKARRKSHETRLTETPAEDELSAGEHDFPYLYLREARQNVSRSTISEKWKRLDGPSINAVGTFLADAQRPVLLRLQDTKRRRDQASSALSMVSRQLRSKLAKGSPFPAPTAGAPTRAGSGAHEGDFDFERTVDAIQNLEKTLDPLVHSVGLLEREIKREENALARDYDTLHTLESNARSEARGWREKAKREHMLVPSIRKGGGEDFVESKDQLELAPKPEQVEPGEVFIDIGDDELVTLSEQIGNHMESIKGNLQQIDGIVLGITESKAALLQVLMRHLDDAQFERVLLG